MTGLSNGPLLAVSEALGIDRSALVAVEGADQIHHQFSVSLTHIRRLAPEPIKGAVDAYGNAFSLDFRIGDFIDLSVAENTSQAEVASFVERAATDYEVVLRVDKTLLLRRFELLVPDYEVRLYLFTDALCHVLEAGLREFESAVWRDPKRRLHVYVADSDARLNGPWLTISGIGQRRSSLPVREHEILRAERTREQRDRFIGWDEPWVASLTPTHLRISGDTSHSSLQPLLEGLFIALAILYLCDRARSRALGKGSRQIRAEFRGHAHVAVIPLSEAGTIAEIERKDLDAIVSLVDWVYAIDPATNSDWVLDRLPFVQTRVAQMLEGRPEEGRFAAFTREARYLVEGVESQWKAFIEGKISAYLENRRDLETFVGDTVVTFRERASDLVKGLSENMLAAVGVLVGTFIAAAFADPFNEDLFRIGMIVYGIYLLIFPGAFGVTANSIRFASARSDFDERMTSYRRLLGSEVDKLVGARVEKASRDYWIATVIVALLYVLVSTAAFCAAERIPPLIQDGERSRGSTSSLPAGMLLLL